MKNHNEDIIRDVAEKTGYDYDTVLEVYNIYFKEMRRCVERDDYFTDFKPEDYEVRKTKFPMWNLGFLYISLERVLKINRKKIWSLINTV